MHCPTPGMPRPACVTLIERFSLCLSAALFLAINNAAVAQTAPRIIESRAEAGRVTLSWTPGFPRYEIQASSDPVKGWRRLLSTRATTEHFSAGEAIEYLRVVGVSTPDLSEAARAAILEDLRQRVVGLPGEDVGADHAVLATHLRSLPEIAEVEVADDQTVWVEFVDGRTLVVMNNRAESSQPGGGSAEQPARHGGLRPTVRAPMAITVFASPRNALPASRRAYLLSHAPTVKNAANELAPWLRDKGYETAVNGPPSVAAWAGITNAGVVYFEGHSAARSVGSSTNARTAFVLVTSDTVDHPLPAAFAEDMGYGIVGPRPGKIHYAVTEGFLRKHVRLGRDAFVFLNSCSSFHPDMFRGFSGATLAGWTHPVADPDAWRTARFLVDRLLGASRVAEYPEIPAQRPFPYPAILTDMASRLPRVDESFPIRSLTLSRLQVAPGLGNRFGLLAPSIERLSMDERTEEMLVLGSFDPALPAEVTVESGAQVRTAAATVVSASELRVSMPIHVQPASGNVVVRQAGRESNVVPLTEWRVRGELVGTFSAGQAQPSVRYSFDLRFRADVHSARRLPHQAPTFVGTSAYAARGSTCQLEEASGVYHDPNGIRTVEWRLETRPELPLTHETLGNGATGFSARLVWNPDGGAYLLVAARARDALTVIERTISSSTGGTVEFSRRSDGFTRSFSGSGQNGAWNRTTYRLEGGAGSVGGDAGRVTWQEAMPLHPPDPTIIGYGE